MTDREREAVERLTQRVVMADRDGDPVVRQVLADDLSLALAALEAAEQRARCYQHIAGLALSGTDEADRIVAAHSNPYECSQVAAELIESRKKALIEYVDGVVKERAEAAEAKVAAMEPVVEALEQARERFVGLLAEHSRMLGDTDDEAMASAERWTRTNEPWEGAARTYRATHMKENHG